MPTLSPAAAALYRDEMHAARTTSDTDRRWHHLERAHILSQPHPWLHTRNHIAMFTLALRQHDRREAAGQVLRIIAAAPVSMTGRYPEGNTGRTAVGLTAPMAPPDDLVVVLADSRKWPAHGS